MIMEFDIYDTKAREMCDHLANALCDALTSNHCDVSDYRSAVMVLLDTTFQQALKVTYRLSVTQARLVRDLLSEYGLHDQLRDTTATGLEGLIEFVVTNPDGR